MVCTGRFARWMSRRGWGAVTLPTWAGAWILYWKEPTPELRRHELVHVAQARRWGVTGFWARYWWHLARLLLYRLPCWGLGAWRWAYERHPMEVEAREAE